MKDFNTKDAVRLLPEVKVNGKDIYLNVSAGNMIKTAGFAKSVDMDDPEEIDKMARLLFTDESYQLVSMLDFDDFVTVLDLASAVLDEQNESITKRFVREE